jgi:hypothetical protein
MYNIILNTAISIPEQTKRVLLVEEDVLLNKPTTGKTRKRRSCTQTANNEQGNKHLNYNYKFIIFL